ncbi:MAG: pyridoxal phosphate-dependent aminotransferase [Candidatus Heimdallarchaeota archaeon]|nr:pyridoxal phosphate-dependent aminotransferase [Candidatus Heimdallarchaeota archaeon]
MPKNSKWNFDEIVDRTKTNAVKWDQKFMEKYFGIGDLLPLWVADMDFRAPKELIDVLKERVEHGIFGYTFPNESYFNSIIHWFERRHNWKIEKDWILYSPGIVPAVKFLIQIFTKPGDGVIIQEPVYYPFKSSIEENGRKVINNELLLENSSYKMDFKDLEEKCQTPRAKMLILCSPHNPVSRVWSKEELTKLGRICVDNGILVISDEIHCDLILPGYKHTIFADISEEFAQKSITCVAPSKTFNIAGLKTSSVIIPNKSLREDFATTMNNVSIGAPGIFGGLATETVYNKCENWLDEMLVYVKENYEYLVNFLKEKLPSLRVFDLEGTYLAWIDFRPLKINPKNLDAIIKKEAKVGLDDGAMFGKSGEGFQRINLACPRTILKDALIRINNTFQTYIKK